MKNLFSVEIYYDGHLFEVHSVASYTVDRVTVPALLTLEGVQKGDTLAVFQNWDHFIIKHPSLVEDEEARRATEALSKAFDDVSIQKLPKIQE